MPLQIIVKKTGTEAERRKSEAASAILKHYHQREIRDGARFRSKAGSKDQIKKVYT